MNFRNKSNIVLIGMPGAGKSTVGVILAKLLGKGFVDTDVLIQTIYGRTLQQILDSEGYLALRRAEERVLLDLECWDRVIATGGSAPYSEAAMEHLKRGGTVIFLHADLATLRRRIRNFDSRGIAKRPDQSFGDLFAERHVLYSRNADLTVEIDDLSQEDVAEYIARRMMAG